MALIVVLSSLVFLAALLVAFMGSVNTELRTSKRYADGVNSDLLSQTAFNLAITQITEATRGYNLPGRQKGEPAPALDQTLAWASQPGMIRTYDMGGSPISYYRLYSWDKLRGDGKFSATTETAALNSWVDNPAQFTDLNEPVTVNGKQEYPILNPSAIGVVEGFKVTSAPASPVNTLPMPVKWLYVLEDGEVVAPTGSAKSVKVSGARADNQIVGRIAFWADDDTNKLNINTASEGSYVDMPRTSSTYDRSVLAMNQPVNNEYQRYPGHPATVSLSTVFPNYAGTAAEDLYPITPRYMAGGSKGGTASTIAQAGLIPASSAPGPGMNRLYASLDELMFSPQRGMNNATNFNKDTLERTKFFLSASSRAPDVNLFNRPRIGIWPLNVVDSAKTRTPHDRLIAFCLTMRNDLAFPYKYYFQRQDRFTTIADLPPLASLGGLGRNRGLIDYLKLLTSTDIPGFGGKFSVKYSAGNTSGGIERDQILTEIFDYIRTTNLKDAVGKSDPSFETFAPVSPTGGGNGNQQYSGVGQVVPIYDAATGTKGFGRYPTVAKGILHFIGVSNPSASTVRVEAGFFVEMFDPSSGLLGLFPEYRIRVKGLEGLRWGPNSAALQSMGYGASITTDRPIAFTIGVEPFTGGRYGYVWGAYHRTFAPVYPLISGRIDLPVAGGQFTFKGGPITVEVLTYPAGAVVQTINMEIPPLGTDTMQLPQPTLGTIPTQAAAEQRQFRTFLSNGGRLGYEAIRSTLILPCDTVRTVEANPGDMRLIAGLKDVPATYFKPHKYYTDATKALAHSLRNSEGYAFPGATGGKLVDVPYKNYVSDYPPNINSLTQAWDWGLPTEKGVALGKDTPFGTNPTDLPGDWDNGFAQTLDGPYINKPDEGSNPATAPSGQVPYYYSETLKYLPMDSGHFSANRQMPSAVMFGSLPTGVIGNKPWQTLQFRPRPLAHPGLVSPKDHLLLDFFHMPVVEPYAISEPLSTAGRINMNYQIAPFSYIERSTGIRAVLKSERIISIADGAASSYKTSGSTTTNFRLAIDPDQTLRGFEDRFKNDDIFRSASEICDIDLVPVGSSAAAMNTYWDDKKLTGDNSRERPYATIYPRLTTKSNTYTVHVKAQALQKRKTNPATWDTWEEGKDIVISEYRGSETIERFVDPNNTGIPDYADANANPMPISDFYRIRVLANKQFAP